MQADADQQRQLREARLALSVFAALSFAALLLGYRYVKSLAPDQGIPDHVMQAPPAQEVDASYIAEVTARRIRAKADPTRAAREYPTPLLPPSDVPRVASRETAVANIKAAAPSPQSAPQSDAINAHNPPLQMEQRSAVRDSRPSAATAAPPRDPFNDRQDTEPKFDPWPIHPQPLVPPRPLPITPADDREEQSHRQQYQPEPVHPTTWTSMNPRSASPREQVTSASPATGPSSESIERRQVRADQSLWLLAQELYGDGQWFRALYQFNADVYESASGSQLLVIQCPPPETLRREFPLLAPEAATTRACARANHPAQPEGFWYTTGPSDTLFDIARQELGQAGRYVEIIDHNRDRLPPEVHHLSRLPAGMQLRLPAGAAR